MVFNAVARSVEQGAELDLEYRIIWPTGSVHWVQGKGQAYQGQEGRTVRMAGTYQDITRRKAAEKQVTTTLAQLEAVLESVDAGLLLMGEDNNTVLWANQNFGNFFGVPDIESIRGNPKLTQVLRQHIEANAVFDGSLNELRAVIRRDPNYRGPAGQIELLRPAPRLLQQFTTPVHNEQAQYIGRLWLYYDITKQRRLEEQVVRYQKVDSIGRLAAGTAHEFNNLLGAIMGFNSLALQKAPRN
jgi:PAS domain-containing protein